jgi:hypothetical protein
VFLVFKVHKDHQVYKDHKVYKELKAQLASKVFKDHRV